MILELVDPKLPVTFTRHADQRLMERTRLEILDAARAEILDGVAEGRVVHQARNVYAVASDDGERVYIVAARAHRLVVITVQCRSRRFPVAA